MLQRIHRPYLSIGPDDFTLAQLELIDGAPWICPSRLYHEIAPACYRGFIVGLQECAEGFSNRRLFEGQDATRGQGSEGFGDLAKAGQLLRPPNLVHLPASGPRHLCCGCRLVEERRKLSSIKSIDPLFNNISPCRTGLARGRGSAMPS